ncbi:hypothetical protein DP939_37995 [Spongiactinospora rosea]|uniref:Uncharacterized protein n=1 Tax=Spongiactinospora rosea TaxID=2248750 RepID=A0A366LPA6_9ACTN|nr:hypothetical protein DP939_37995 [Spongiactinospora rosea]
MSTGPDLRRPNPPAVVQARRAAGNAAMAAALGDPSRGPMPWARESLLAGQNLVGNQAVARRASAPKPLPVRPARAKKAAAPDTEHPAAKDTSTAERPDRKAAREQAGRRSPGADPKFQALKKDVGAKKRRIGTGHPPATAEAGAAQAAAVPPADDREARGKAAHAEDMDAARPKEFDKQAFIAAVKKAVADRAPKNLDEADKFGKSGKADQITHEVRGKVGEGKDASAREIAETTAQVPAPAPDAKQVVPLTADRPPARPPAPDPGQATPDRLPASATDLSAGPAQVDRQMAQAKVTEQQLSFRNSREPSFDKAVRDKKSMEAHSATAPRKLRAGESRELAEVKNTAAARGTAAMAGMHGVRVSTGRQVGTGKQGAKGRDEDKRRQVTEILQKVFDATKGDVEKILTGLDRKVDEEFAAKEKRARERFTADHEEGMRRYKDARYSGLSGKLRWVRDLFAGLPEEANRIYERAKDTYLAAMDQIITDIAGTVERELKRAKDRIATGRKDLQAAVDGLPADLKAIGREAATEFAGRFDELKDTVNDKGTELVDTLAAKYTDAVRSVDEEIAAEKEKNKGLVAKAAEAIGGAIETVIELGRMLLGVLRKAASAIGMILKDPIGFLGNLVTGVGGGLRLFARNAGRHLQQGVLTWLLGTGAAAGVRLPRTFDVLGIVTMIGGMLGISWPNIRARLARKVPDQAIVAAETAVPLVAQVRRRGVAGMWDDLKSYVGDLKKQLIDDLVSYLLPTIIIAGITWIVSLFNPASAFIRACKMIIDIIRFVVTNARQIIEFVNAVLDAVIAIARGGTGGVPALVERALARSIPVLIGALAALLGIGGIAGKVRQIFQKLSRPVNRAIDRVIDKIAGLVKKLWAKIKPKPRKPERPDARRPGPTRPRRPERRPERRPDRRPDRRREPSRRPEKGPRRPEPAQPRDKDLQHVLDAALRDAHGLVRTGMPVDEIRRRIPAVQRRHRLTALSLVVERLQGDHHVVHFVATINPSKASRAENSPLSRKKAQAEYGILVKNSRKFQRFADRNQVIIDVRPTNPDSVRHLIRGAWYKPVDIKAKTINTADTFLNIAPEKKGLVGFFVHPVPEPKVANLAEKDAQTGWNRYRMRVDERAKYGPKMRALARKPLGPGRFNVIGHVVHGYDEYKRPHPIAGDHDLYDIRRPDGSEIPRDEYDLLIEDMRRGKFGVMHGAVARWDPEPEEREMRDKLVRQHQRGGDEGLVRFAPGQPIRFVVAETPPWTDPRPWVPPAGRPDR